jgi:molybdate transport system substrate-binding protein
LRRQKLEFCVIRIRVFRPVVIFAITAIMALALTGCGDDDGEDSPRDASPRATEQGAVSGDITVFAASSLTEAFSEIGDAFEDAHSGTSVEFNFDGSQALRTQLEQGARADLFASANTSQMDMAVESGVVASDSEIFARNRLVVIVPKDNPGAIQSLQDLANPGIKLVLANEDVPVGAYSRRFLDKASADPAFGAGYRDDVLANLVSEESNVRQVAAKVQLGEADAAIVYTSDVTEDLAEDVATIEIPDALNEIATYPIALTAEPGSPSAAQAFIEFVLSEQGQAILVRHGFLPAAP